VSTFHGNDGEMERFHRLSGEDVEAILEGTAPPSPVGDYLAWLRTVESVEGTTATAQIAAAADAVRLAPVHSRASRRYRWRRRTVFGSFITAIVAKVLAASVALAAVTGGVGAIANSAAPGDPLYKVDTFMERVGLFDGGTRERLQEAERLVTRDQVFQGLELAGTAIGQLRDGYGPAADALEQAAVQVQTRTQTSEQYRDDLTEMLRIMTRQMQQRQVNQVNETAEQVRETTREMLNQPTETPDTTTTTTVPSTTSPGSSDGHHGGDDTGSQGGSDNGSNGNDGSGGNDGGGNGAGGH
jgi:uncharacterized membrane protein YgcG